MNHFLKRTWAVINLDHLDYNIETLKNQLTDKTKIMAVVKADGYGHGDHVIAHELSLQGVDFFAVSNLTEALSLRRGGIDSNILILGFTPPSQAKELASFNIIQTVFSTEYAELLNEKCKDENVTVKVHIKLDTGMSRIGFSTTDYFSTADEVEKVCRLSQLDACGIFSHLSSADTLDTASNEYTKMQVTRFNNVVNELAKRNIKFACRHLQNSAGIAFLPNLYLDYARAGIVLYGIAPSGEKLPFDILPLMELKTVISMVKHIPAKTSISYNRKFVSSHEMTIATVPIGYADGYPRTLSNKGYMLVHGKRAPILGNICMDQLMLDVSGIDNVKMGDVVTVVGKDGNEMICFDELAAIANTISYELVCLIGRRVPRIYTKNSKTVAVVDYVNP